MELKEISKEFSKWMKGQTLKKQDFVDFLGGESNMKGLKTETVVNFTNKSLLT